MKKILLSLCLSAFSLAGWAQTYSVSTEKQNKNVLLESFVGSYCKWCGTAPDIINTIESVLGDRLNTIMVHYGSHAYASYTTTEGDRIADLLGAYREGFPNAGINRHNWNYDGQYCFGRGNWSSRSKQAVSETAPVNLHATAAYDNSNRTMSIRVEGYFTAAEVAPQQRLHVLLTENNVIGYQKTPQGFFNNFAHQHMLRAAISSIDGDLLSDCKPNTYFVKEFSYHLPFDFNGTTVNPAELELVIFVTAEDGKHVSNSISVKPSYQNMTIPVNAEIKATQFSITDGYLFNFMPLVMTNRCDSELTSAQFEISLNGDSQQVEWTGSIGAFESAEIHLPINWKVKANEMNVYAATLLSVNGESVTSKTVNGTFNGEVLETPTELHLKMSTSADDPELYSYTLYDADGQVVKTFGPYESNVEVVEVVHLLPGQQYCFEIKDTWGNGYMPAKEALKLCDKNGNVLKLVDTVKGFGCRVFFTTQSEQLPVTTTFGNNVNRALATFSAPYPTTPSSESVRAYYAVAKDQQTISLQQIHPQDNQLVIPANVGVVLTTTRAESFTMNFSDQEATPVAAQNLLRATGSSAVTVDNAKNAYVLGKKNNDVLFHVLSPTDRKIAANLAYLELPANMNAHAIKVVFDGEVTDIEQLLVRDYPDTPIYDLSGRRVMHCVKGGFYIQDGKKFIVK